MKTLLPEFKISLKHRGRPADLVKIKTSEQAAALARQCFDADMIEWVESFVVIALNRRNLPLGFYKLSSGGITGTVCDPRVIMQFALLSNATGLILAHNHPSGNKNPSDQDRDAVAALEAAAKVLHIHILDHIIVTADDFYSFNDTIFINETESTPCPD